MSVSRRFVLTASAALFAAPAVAAVDKVRLRALYNRDRGVSDLARSLEGRRIAVEGFMAPPLRADAKFFVLTMRPMALCPFCDAAADWPDDILAVHTKRVVRVTAFDRAITVSGWLELGAATDADTGFVSLVRITDASYR